MNDKFNVLLTFPEISTIFDSLVMYLHDLKEKIDSFSDDSKILEESVAFLLYKKFYFLLEEIGLNDE